MAKYAIPRTLSRSLTANEKRLGYRVFGPALKTDRIRIHNRAYLPGQGKGVAMTPNGEIWFRADDYKTDFARNVLDAAWLIHEFTHAWQLQTGRSVRFRGLLEQFSRLVGRDPYAYGKLDPQRPFSTYKNEQQAAIVEDYYRVSKGF